MSLTQVHEIAALLSSMQAEVPMINDAPPAYVKCGSQSPDWLT